MYQFPMGKVKKEEAETKFNQCVAYQFPMGKVK